MPDPTQSTPFPGIDPNQISLIHAIAQAAQGDTSGIPQAPPSATPAPASPMGKTSPFDLRTIAESLANIPQYAEQSRKLSDIGAQEKAVQEQMAAEPIPKMGFQPNFQPHHFLHNLGQALIAVAASTRPGQEVQQTVYGPGIERYQAKQKNLAAQLEALKGQEAVPSEQMRALTGLTGAASLGAYRGGELQVRSDRNDIAKRNSDIQAQKVANDLANNLVRQAQGWQRLSIQDRELAQRQWFEKAMTDIAQQRVAAGMDENSARIQAQEDIKAALSQNQYATQHPFLNMLGLTPDLTSAPAAGTPKNIGTPAPAKPSKPSKGGAKVLVEGKDF